MKQWLIIIVTKLFKINIGIALTCKQMVNCFINYMIAFVFLTEFYCIGLY